MRNVTYVGVVAAVVIFAACSSSAQQPKSMLPTDVVATVGSASITLAEVDEIALQAPVSTFGNSRLVHALYLARRAALEDLIGKRLMDTEAKTRGIDRATLIEQEIANNAPAPTASDIEFWYQNNPARVQGASLDQVREPIKRLLIEERMDRARQSFIAKLKDKTPVTVSLDPPRSTVSTDGHPAKGPKDAPIQMVEFSDFQCPFCQRANSTIQRVLSTYGEKIHFVYRHFPLPNHPNARPAAEASECAEEQGRFWPFHDSLFVNTSKLTDSDLKAHALDVGLDVPKFTACFESHKYKERVEKDIADGNEAGVTGTPAFFINGRVFEGAQPFEAFKRVIDEELATRK
jgi:protein-disulfide isomerase